MPPHPQWPELLEEHAYLVQMLSEAAHDLGALEHTCSLLEVFRADLRTCTTQLADLEREKRESSPKHHDSKIASSASKIYHRVAATIHLDKEKEKHGLGEDEKQDRLLAVWTTKRTLGTEVKNLESKAQFLRRQIRHYDEFQRRLVTLHAHITEEREYPSREEDEAEEDIRRAQNALYVVQKTLERHKTLATLLRHGDYALINAGRHLTVGGSGGSSGVDAAKRCAVQTSVVVDQARRLDLSFFEQEDAGVLKAGWLREVFQTTSANDSHAPSLLQALKPHHTALLSLISRAHKLASDYDAAVRHAARRFSEARARRDALKRQVLMTLASAEAERSCELSLVNQESEEDGLAKMRDVTAGLEAVIPIAAMPRSSTAVSPSRPSEERRVGQDEPASRPSPVIPQLHAPQSSRQPLPSNLTPDLVTPTSSPLSTPPSGSDLRTHARDGSANSKLRQPALVVRRPLSAELSPRQASSAGSILQPKPVHHQNRHPVLEYQYDQQWQSGSGPQHDDGRSPQSQGQAPPRPSERDEAIFQSQPQPHPGQPPLPIQSSSPSSIRIQSLQQTAKPLQPPASNISNPSADSRPQSSASVQNVRSGTAEPRQMPPPTPLSQPIPPLPQVITPSYQSHPREPKPKMMSPQSSAQLGRPEPQTAGGSSRSSPNATQATIVTFPPSTANSPSQRPAVHGILKQSPAPVTPHPSTAADADPWGLGVKVAAAAPSRPQPKLKTVFKLWRSADGLKNADSDTSRVRVAPQTEEQPSPLSKKPNPRAAIQTLRFSEAVEIVPRPAVDSDPYEDEDENELPPSPKRGSMIWLQNEGEDPKEGSDDSSGDVSEMERRPNATEVPVKTTFAANPSQSSISSASSSYLTDYSAYSALSSTTTPPSSVTSPLASNWLSGAGLSPVATTSPQDLQYVQPGIGRTRKEKKMPHDDRELTDTQFPNADMGRLASPQGPNVIPSDNPSSHRITSESKSDHELLQTMFPSPAQTSISHHNLMFTS